MPGFGQFLDDVHLKSRSGSTDSNMTRSGGNRFEAVLFPAGFGVAVGERFDDVAAIPRGLHIERIKRITLYHGAWLDSIATTYVLSDGSDYTCSTGRKGARSSTYEFASNEILLAMGGLLGFIKNTDIIVDDLMIDYLQFHIKDTDTGEIRIVPEDPESFGSSQGADFFVQGPILAFSGRNAGYLSQIQPYLAKEKDVDFGLPAPGMAFDDRKALRHDGIKRIKQITVWAGAWIDGMEVAYETKRGQIVTQGHGGTGGNGVTINLADDEVVEAICVCNSGPFPFCDAIRFYLVRYTSSGQAISRRTVPDESSSAFGYEYEFGENTWIRSGKGATIFAFAGTCGSYVEDIACWVRDDVTGEEKLVKPVKMAASPSGIAAKLQHAPPLSAVIKAKMEEHRRSFSSTDGLPVSNSLTMLPPHTSSSFSASPEVVLPVSLPSSPSLPISLGRLSFCSTDSRDGDYSPASAGLDPNKKKRLSAQLALLHGEDIQTRGRRQSNGNLAPL